MYSKKSTTQGKAASNRAPAKASVTGRRFEVRASGVHGKGVFARRPIKSGDRIVEYTGDVITWKQAQKRAPHNPDEPNHTFFFHIDDKRVIDGGSHGNAARWINHACDPNCEADDVDGRVFVKALRDIAPGEELNYDYGLILEGRHTAKVKKEFECRCGAATCRRTMLAPKR
ncbi:MAG: SET domain-containing protein-lysine N-methyltransferase [Pseudomonadota bacterium]|nr:SET domain-containing protein-lysine N-methyltransferase [Pseudomonadota bacterium]